VVIPKRKARTAISSEGRYLLSLVSAAVIVIMGWQTAVAWESPSLFIRAYPLMWMGAAMFVLGMAKRGD
jgi:hypothetical protein